MCAALYVCVCGATYVCCFVCVCVCGVTSAGKLSTNSYTYDISRLRVAPSITSISPLSGPTEGGTLVTIIGKDFGVTPDAALVQFTRSNAAGAVSPDADILACRCVCVCVCGRVCVCLRLYEFR